MMTTKVPVGITRPVRTQMVHSLASVTMGMSWTKTTKIASTLMSANLGTAVRGMPCAPTKTGGTLVLVKKGSKGTHTEGALRFIKNARTLP